MHRLARIAARILPQTRMGLWIFLVFLPTAQAADTIYVQGTILTMAGDRPQYVESLVVTDGKIAFAGSRDEAMQMRTANTKVVDLGGKALLPGFIDAHSHYSNSLLVANQCKLYAPPSGPGKDVPTILATLKAYAAERNIPKGELIVGYGYDDTVMPDGRLLNRDDLDEAFPENPVRIDHVSMHGAVLNSLALKKYGVSAATKTPPGGVIVRKPGTEEPWGLIMETAFLPIFEQSDPMTERQEIEWSRAGQLLYAEAGITTAHEGASHLPQMLTMQRASQAGANIIDIVAYPFITDLAKVLEQFPYDRWGKYENNFKIGGVKITLDGSPQGRTAFFTTPYLSGGPNGESNWKGEPTFRQELVHQMIQGVYERKVPLLVHCNGDAAIDAFLEAYEWVRRGDYSEPWNVTTIHTQFLRKDQIPKFVKYRIRPSFYTLHTYYFADAHIANRGAAQAASISPMRTAIDVGLHPTNHTDFVVAPLDQMMMLWSAVNRRSRSGDIIGAEQRVTAYEGLKSMTAWAAEQYGEQDSKGTLERGKLADLVILDQDPLRVDPSSINKLQVVATIKKGRQIYPVSEELPPLPPPNKKAPGPTVTWRAHVCDRVALNLAANRTWTLVTLQGNSIDADPPLTLRFENGTVTAFAGVNQMSAAYFLVGDSVSLQNFRSTRKAGPVPLMELEDKFAQMLGSVDAFQVKEEKLSLLSNGEVVAEFR